MAQIGKYNIKAISNIVGILPGTLRAWERRYNIISPVRNDAGHRLYTEEHVYILKWLVQKVNEGFTIGQAINLYEAKEHKTSKDEVLTENFQSDHLVNKIVSSLLSFEEGDAHNYVNEAFSIFSIDKVLFKILAKVIILIGDKWRNGEITSAHEHFASSFLRTRLGMIYQNLPNNKHLPKLIAVCGPEEKHELALLIFTIYLRRIGFQVIYLGASIDSDDVEQVINEVNPAGFILSCTLKEHLKKTIDFAIKIKKLEPNVIIGIGGHAVSNCETPIMDSIQELYVGDQQANWDEWLKQNFNYK
ncbi:MerR family transcriptional regulator [Bacillus sp. EAC]|uniref:MerR family transcriptional regulator n=1 Tax=Bacillus sp. EAC TaxID=1978338 RepID=UPI000B44E92C|nr:MerR family transcriptional regulator [Bacillus sp. EAC]